MTRKETVQRFVDDAVNGGRDEVIDELFTSDMAGQVRDWFGAFRNSFPDMRMELVSSSAKETRWSRASPARPPTSATGAVTPPPAAA